MRAPTERVLINNDAVNFAVSKRPQFRPWHRQFLGTVLLLFILLFLRRPDSLLNAQFWAEDAAVYYNQQILYHFWTLVFTPYGGYLDFIPRAIAASAWCLPTVYAPLFCNMVSLLLAAICCALFVLPAYRYIVESDFERFVICFLLASAIFCDEMSANITNLHWFLTVGAVLIVFRKTDPDAPSGILPAILIGIAGAAIGCTAALPVLLLPFLLWKLLRYRSTERIWIGLMSAGVAVQAATLIGQHAAEGMSASPNQIVFSTLVAYVYRVVLCMIAGLPGAIWVSQHQLSGVVLSILVLITIWLSWLYGAGNASVRRIVLIGLYLSFSSIAMAMVARQGTVSGYSSLVGLTAWRGERHFFLSAGILILLVAISIRVRWPEARTSIAAVLLCAIFLAGLLGNFRMPAYTDYHWAAEAGQIDAWRKAWAAGKPVQGVLLTINPGWTIEALPSRVAAATKDSPWEGCVVGTRGNAEVYFVEGGRKHRIMDSKWLPDHGLKWPEDRVLLSEADMAKIPPGDAMVQ